MSGDASGGDDLPEKIRHYQDQLEQVEAALTINPSHVDLLSIKNDLVEIIKILNSQLTDEKPSSIVRGRGPSDTGVQEIKTEHECSTEVKTLACASTSTAGRQNLIQIKLENDESSESSSDPIPSSSSGATVITPGIEDYLKFRQKDKKMFNHLGKYAKKHSLKEIEKMPKELKEFVSELLPDGVDVKGQPISIAHRDFRDVTDRALKNRLNRQKKKIRRIEINAERAAKGLPPIFLKKRTIPRHQPQPEAN